MNSVLTILVVAAWLAIVEPVNSSYSDHENNVGNEPVNESYSGIGKLQLFPRSSDGRDINTIPVLNAEKAISSIEKIGTGTKRNILSSLRDLENGVSQTLPTFARLFSHIRCLMEGKNSKLATNFTKESLLVEVSGIPNTVNLEDDITNPLNELKDLCAGTEMATLFSSIVSLLEEKALLQNYAKLWENVNKVFHLDETSEVLGRGKIPVPTSENPVVYYELKDERLPSVRVLVRMKLEQHSITRTILFRTRDSDGYSSTSITTFI